MKKNFYLISISLLMYISSWAQLKDGAVAPNWTLPDINGNVHTLYEYLDDGKFVVLDFSATWCGPCWNYHNSGAMKSFYNTYGPEGTNEAMVFFVEGDPGTSLDNLHGIGSTMGNWVLNTPYPIIDLPNNTVAGAYKIAYFPTVYIVYPNRSIYEVGQASFNGFKSNLENMPRQATEDVEIKMMNFEGTTLFCDEDPSFGVRFQNYGLEPLESATFQIVENGEIIATKEWTGNLERYGFETITFDESIEIEDEINVEIKAEAPGQEIFELSQLSDITLYTNPELQAGRRIKIHIFATENASFTRWELKTGNGGTHLKEDNLESNKLYTYTVFLSIGECYQLNIFNDSGQGLGSGGYYKILDRDDNTLVEVNEFTFKSTTNFMGSTTVSAENISSVNNFVISPNPVSSELNIQLESIRPDNYNIQVLTGMGQVMYSSRLDSNESNRFSLNIPTYSLKPGVYYISVTNGSESMSRKFVKL